MKKSQISVFETMFGIFLVFSFIFVFSSLSNFSTQESFPAQESLDSFLLSLSKDDEFKYLVSRVDLTSNFNPISNPEWNDTLNYISDIFPRYSLVVHNTTHFVDIVQCRTDFEFYSSDNFVTYFNLSNSGELELRMVTMGVCS